MAQLFFKYGAMNAGKSIDILKVAHNYQEQEKKVVLLTSRLDTRSGQAKVASRIGIQQSAIAIGPGDSVLKKLADDRDAHCILVDEAQFFEPRQVRELASVVDELGIPVMAYGLKNDFQNRLFPGSETLLAYADKIEEIKTICWYCSKKATMNLRLQDGRPVYDGEQVQIGGNDSYRSVCRKHYHHPPL